MELNFHVQSLVDFSLINRATAVVAAGWKIQCAVAAGFDASVLENVTFSNIYLNWFKIKGQHTRLIGKEMK